MDRQRDIQDYQLLAAVRRRRNESLQAEVRLARSEHEHCVARESAAEVAMHASLRRRDAYAEKTRTRTSPGQAVRLGELDGARSHGTVLTGDSESAAEACRQATASVAKALARYVSASRELASNEARVLSLVEQADRWKRAAELEVEEREEDERGDAGRISNQTADAAQNR